MAPDFRIQLSSVLSTISTGMYSIESQLVSVRGKVQGLEDLALARVQHEQRIQGLPQPEPRQSPPGIGLLGRAEGMLKSFEERVDRVEEVCGMLCDRVLARQLEGA